MSLVFITGGGGFIGYHLQKKLSDTYQVASIDLLDNPTNCIRSRKKHLTHLTQGNILQPFLSSLLHKPKIVIHLAAETGIAASLKHPEMYFDTNVKGTFNVLEECRKNGVKYLIYASSSSVYSPNQEVMHEDGETNTQLSFYGTTKKMTETMIENYCMQYAITAIGLRFFTVYGSYTRPDMAAYKFMKAINSNHAITLYNEGKVYRDFTHVSDIVHSISLLAEKIIHEPLGTHQIFNIGYGQPISVLDYANKIAVQLNKLVQLQFQTLPENELESTHSDTTKLEQYINYKPKCDIDTGIAEMIDWFKTNDYE
jgi:UDP-glucuronate 4-epimerase